MQQPHEQSAIVEKQRAGRPLSVQGASILIVDDEPDSLEALQRLLSHDGFEVTSASSGNEAIALVQERRPDLIICDLMMPQMTGFDLCLHLHQRTETRGIPIIMLSGFFVGDPLADVYDRTLLKPVDHDELVAEIRSLLEKPS
jgi:CheY-like chemotaxis protein